MKHRRPRLRLRPAIELVPRSHEFVPAAARPSAGWAGRRGHGIIVRWLLRRGRRQWRSQEVRGFVPAGDGIVPDIALFWW